MQTQLPQIVTLIFTIVTAAGVLLQACVLLGMYLAVRQSTKKLHEVTDELRVHLVPTLSTAGKLLEDLSPKLKVITTDLVEVSHALRSETGHVKATVDDVLDKTTAQAARVNEMLDAVFNSVEHASAVVQQSVAVPYRRVSGIMAGLKAGFEVLLSRDKDEAAAACATAAEATPIAAADLKPATVVEVKPVPVAEVKPAPIADAGKPEILAPVVQERRSL